MQWRLFMEVLELIDGYDRGTKAGKRKLKFRNPADVAEMRQHCEKSSHIWFVSTDGTARQAKVNGAVRIWKRDPNRIEVPIKYGMYEYGTFEARDINRVLIPIPNEGLCPICGVHATL